MNHLLVKEPDENDLAIIEYLNNLQVGFKLDDLNSRIIHKLVFDGTVPVAYGITKRIGEAIFLVNPKASKLLRARAMMELMKHAEYGSKIDNCYQLQCFVGDPNLVKLLEKQYQFTKTKDSVLVKNL